MLDPSSLLPQVLALAKQAGAAIMAIYANPVEVRSKRDASPLTEADLVSHHIISEGLATITPEWPVLSMAAGNPPFP